MKLAPYSSSWRKTIFLFRVHPNAENIYTPVVTLRVNTVQKRTVDLCPLSQNMTSEVAMGDNIEAVIVSQKLETITRKGVTCIFCGLPTPVPASSPRKFSSHLPSHISIVRCNCAVRRLLTAPVTSSSSARSVKRKASNPSFPRGCQNRVGTRLFLRAALPEWLFYAN